MNINDDAAFQLRALETAQVEQHDVSQSGSTNSIFSYVTEGENQNRWMAVPTPHHKICVLLDSLR